MDKNEEDLVKVITKLDMLINDFQRHRDRQEENWKAQRRHVLEEEKSLSSIKNQLNWHVTVGGTAIGAFIYHVLKGAVA